MALISFPAPTRPLNISKFDAHNVSEFFLEFLSGTMKVRIADDLPIVPLRSGTLQGKILVSLEDNAGFSMYEFNPKAGDQVMLSAFHPNHNHIYYCIEGRCTIHKDAHEELQFTADHLLALTSENSVHANVEEPMKIIVVSVPQDPNMSPSPLFLKGLSEVVDSDRNVPFGEGGNGGCSRRFLAAPDGYNISVHNTLVNASFNAQLHYSNNMEANYFFKGKGEYLWENGQQQHTFEPGTMLLVEKEAHEVRIGASRSTAICVFFPPLKGTERLKLNQESGPSY